MAHLRAPGITGIPPRPIFSRGKKKFGLGPKNFSPVPWSDYFEEKQFVEINHDRFRVYKSGTEGPVICFLHGGGFSSLSWACLTKSISENIICQCIAIDIRGHGDTETTNNYDLCLDTICQDISAVLLKMYGDEPPPIMLVGHSMGGALAVHLAYRQLIESLIGLAVIDVVEGTALESLKSMQSYLKSRPKSFPSLQNAVEWSVKSGYIRNVESAKVSMGGQVKKVIKVYKNDDVDSKASSTNTQENINNDDSIIEEENEDDENSDGDNICKKPKSDSKVVHSSQALDNQEFIWKIDLSKTEKYWRSWFENLSSLFLSSTIPKLLLLAGVDRLDKDLTVGQMQGKFQMQILQQCGHAVHEDNPDQVADIISNFMVRHRVANAKESFERWMPAC